MAELIREGYLRELESFTDRPDLIKIITGVRRSGKSTILSQFRSRLESRGERVVYMDMERLGFSVTSDREMYRYITESLGPDGGYVLIDEVQFVPGWERVVNTVRANGSNVYVTGSNARVLSSDFTTIIGGRYVEIHVLPLSFAEYLELHPGDRDSRFNSYLRYGSLPEVDPDRGGTFCDVQLMGIFNTVLVEDILGRLGTGDANTLRAIARFLYTNVGNETNVHTIAKEVGIGNETVSRYLSKLTEAFLFYESEKYDIVGKKVLRTNGKFYASDLGMRNAALLGAGGTDISRPLENVVYLELVRRGYTVRVGSYRDWKVDFTAVRGGETEYYQVCLTMMSEDTRVRELRSLDAIRDNFPKTVLTLDRFGLGSENGIRIVNVLDWLTDGQ